MRTLEKLIIATSGLALIASPAFAMPRSSEELRRAIQTEYGGEANAYVEANESEFRRMGCKGRNDLLQVLLEEGLVLAEVSYRTQSKAAMCAFWKNDLPTITTLFTPDFITAYELAHAGEASSGTLLWNAIYSDDYGKVRHLLENGVHAFNHHSYWEPLTREEHLMLAADSALNNRKENAIRAFGDAGYGHILSAARNEDNVTYVTYRLKGGKPSGGGGSGLLRTLVGGLAGAALGGTAGAAVGLWGGPGEDSNEGKRTTELSKSGPLPLATNRAEIGVVLTPIGSPRNGLQVSEVLAGGAAEAAGLKVTDFIVSIAGEPVASRGSLYVATRKAAAMEEFEVSFIREGKLSVTTFGPPPPSQPAPAEASQSIAATTETQVSDSTLERLERLGDLRDRGIITEDEFETMKGQILAGE